MSKHLIDKNRWYNSHGQSYTMADFVELEVKERDNYNMEDIDKWWELYDIGYNTPVIWVTSRERCADWYSEGGEVYDMTDKIVDIIEESCDGDDGYLAILEHERLELKNAFTLVKRRIGDMVIDGHVFDPKEDMTPVESAWITVLLISAAQDGLVDTWGYVKEKGLERHFREI